MNPCVKRVLMTGDTVGGVWSFTLELASALASDDIQVMLAAMGGRPSESQRAEAAQIPNLRLLPSAAKLEWMEDPWHDVEQSGRWLLECEKQYQPDVVHLNTFGHGALPWNAPTILTAHSCVASWWSAVKQEPLPCTWNRYYTEVRRSLHAVDQITAPTRTMLATLADNYGIDLNSGNCSVIPNSRQPGRFRQAAKEPFILTAGRLWDHAKNIQSLTAAAAHLPWPVYLAGEQTSPDGSQLPLSGCRPLGQLSSEQLSDWYARAAIYALPAKYEPFGLSILEAALSGCALVLGDIPSLRELWTGAALFVQPDDSRALAAACQQLIDNPGLRETLARASIERARAFTPERMASSYLDTYCLALTGRYACAS